MKAARKKLWGWYFFDWATQPYSTLMLTFVFGPFFATIASEVYIGSGLAEQAADAKAQSIHSMFDPSGWVHQSDMDPAM